MNEGGNYNEIGNRISNLLWNLTNIVIEVMLGFILVNEESFVPTYIMIE
jgi:hypothetical protein